MENPNTNLPVTSQSKGLTPGETPAAVVDTVAVSQALHAALSRSFLDLPLGEAVRSLPSITAKRIEEPVFLRLTQIGKPLGGTAQDTLNALQNVLTACHAPDKFTLIFVLASDGSQNMIYLGAQSHETGRSARRFMRSVGNFLEANWPGTQLRPCNMNDEILLGQFQQSAGGESEDDFGYAIALTGVPSLKAGERSAYPQTLDRLLNGMRGCPFVYLVIAEPMHGGEVDGMVYRCRDLISEVHSITKTDLTRSTNIQRTHGETETRGITDTTGKSKAESQGKTKTDAGRWQIFKENVLWASMLAAKPLGQDSQTTTDTITRSHAESFSQSTNWSLALSSGESLGQEFINTHAQAVETLLQQYVKRFEQSRALGCWNVGAYLFAKREDVARQGAMQMKALLTGEKSLYEPIRTHELHRLWGDQVLTKLRNFEQPVLGLVKPDVERNKTLTHADRLEHLLGLAFSGLTTPLGTEELALLTNLPQREIAGIPLVPTTVFSLNVSPSQSGDVILGQLLEGGRPTSMVYAVSPRTLTKHALVTGITGSGKSTTCLRLLHELQQQRIPFLVIEPAKDEYVAWALQRNKNVPPDQRIRVYMPGVTAWRGQTLEHTLRLNPLDVVWLDEKHPPPVLSHVDRLKSILNATFPMQEALPILLEEVLFAVYGKPVNWLGDELPPFGSLRPTLRQMYDSVRDVVKQKGYEERVTANLTAALMTRLNSLRRGWKGRLFDRPDSTPWPEIFDQPAVINLAQLGDDADRAFAMAVLLQFLYEYRQAQAESAAATDSPLRHLTVVEEAHRVLLRTAGGGLEQANPQGKVAEMFSNILSEIRAYGEGLLIVDQVPARLIPDAIKNTNLKIVHRLVASDDREAMGGCMTLTPDQTALINRLRAGQAIVYGDQDDMAAWVQVARDSAT